MIEFYRTRAGRQFFDGTLPRIARALERIADSLEKIEKNSQENLYNNRNERGE